MSWRIFTVLALFWQNEEKAAFSRNFASNDRYHYESTSWNQMLIFFGYGLQPFRTYWRSLGPWFFISEDLDKIMYVWRSYRRTFCSGSRRRGPSPIVDKFWGCRCWPAHLVDKKNSPCARLEPQAAKRKKKKKKKLRRNSKTNNHFNHNIHHTLQCISLYTPTSMYITIYIFLCINESLKISMYLVFLTL